MQIEDYYDCLATLFGSLFSSFLFSLIAEVVGGGPHRLQGVVVVEGELGGS